MFDLLRSVFRRRSNIDRFRDAISIDVSGPEFFDLYPTRQDIHDRLENASIFRIASLDAMVGDIHRMIADGTTIRAITTKIIRKGDLIGRDELKGLGINPSRKIGREFLSACAANDIIAACDRLEHVLHVACATANNRHNIRRSSEVGVTQWIFRACKDERDTSIERMFDGRAFDKISALKLIDEHEDDIYRSTFIAVVEF